MRAFLLFLMLCIYIDAKEFRVASYNVENLFDDRRDGTEYKDYRPKGKSGWTQHMYHTKLTHLSRVIKDVNADILGLCEIENTHALKDLQSMLLKKGLDYPYYAIADKKKGAVRVGILSMFPITQVQEIRVKHASRTILRATVEIEGNILIVYMNHWKSKRGPESKRHLYAHALKRDIDTLDTKSDFLIIGDLNENYNEAQTILHKKNRRLNNTDGITGINHILKTSDNNTLVNEKKLTTQTKNNFLYNLWLELPKKERYSIKSKKYKNTHDHIIVSRGLYDTKGITYIDNSFNTFKKPYLLTKRGYVARWKQTHNKRKKHLGQGFSDHLCVYADFKTQ